VFFKQDDCLAPTLGGRYACVLASGRRHQNQEKVDDSVHSAMML